MGFLQRLFGIAPPVEEIPPRVNVESARIRLLQLIKDKLLSCGEPVVSEVQFEFEGKQLMACNRRLIVMAEVIDIEADRIHGHVFAGLPNPKAPQGADWLDACVFGSGPSGVAIEQAAEIWLHCVAAPILSCLSGQPVMAADHFGGAEPWGVPDRHGFVGPFFVRGDAGAVDMDALAECDAFRFDGYPDDTRLHLVKVVLQGGNRKWKRNLEIDGHAITHEDEDWSCSLPAPAAPVVGVRFAVFHKP